MRFLQRRQLGLGYAHLFLFQLPHQPERTHQNGTAHLTIHHQLQPHKITFILIGARIMNYQTVTHSQTKSRFSRILALEERATQYLASLGTAKISLPDSSALEGESKEAIYFRLFYNLAIFAMAHGTETLHRAYVLARPIRLNDGTLRSTASLFKILVNHLSFLYLKCTSLSRNDRLRHCHRI